MWRQVLWFLWTQENFEQEGEAYSIYGPNHDKALAMLRQGPWKLIRLADGSKTQAVYELYNRSKTHKKQRIYTPTKKIQNFANNCKTS